MTCPNDDDRSQDLDGAELLDKVHAAFGRYVIFPSPEACDATVLWCAATHGQPAWEHAPRLAAISPVKRCGKSRLMDVTEAVCHNVLMTVNVSVAALVRSINPDDPPTLMVDEADTLFGTKRAADNHEDVRGILNSGHQRNRPYTRWDMLTRSQEQCPTFAMAMLAGIGDLPDTIMDRSVVIRMRRRAPGETVAPFRSRRDGPTLRALAVQLRQWIRANLDTLTAAEPDMPVEDRVADTWEPLFAVAQLAGGGWQGRCRRACLALSGDDDDDGGLGIRLLADLYDVWGTEPNLFTTTILERLNKVEESPWADWGRKGEGLTARGLAALLKLYEVKSQTVRIGDQTGKGYKRADLTDSWTRYVTSVTTSQPFQIPATTGTDGGDGSVTDRNLRSVTVSDLGQQAISDAVTDVTDGVRKTALCDVCGQELARPESVQLGVCRECWINTRTQDDPPSQGIAGW